MVKKRKNHNGSKPKVRQPQKTHKLPIQRTEIKNVKSYLLSGVAKFFYVLTIIVTVSYFYPKVSIVKSENLFPQNPFKNPFYIANDGNTAVTNIRYEVVVKECTLVGNNKISNLTARNFGNMKHIKRLDSNKKSYISIGNVIVAPPNFIESASIEIVYLFKIPIVPFTFRDKASFKIIQSSDGKFVWLDDN